MIDRTLGLLIDRNLRLLIDRNLRLLIDRKLGLLIDKRLGLLIDRNLRLLINRNLIRLSLLALLISRSSTSRICHCLLTLNHMSRLINCDIYKFPLKLCLHTASGATSQSTRSTLIAIYDSSSYGAYWDTGRSGCHNS